MKLGRFVWSKVSAPVLWGLAMVGLTTPVKAEPPAPPAPAASSSDPLAPSSLLSGPSLYETGRIGVSAGAASPAPTPVPQELQWAGNGEKSIKPVAADIADAPPPRPPEGVIDPARLEQEIAANLESVENCRVDVARTKRVQLGKVTADQLLLRWTIAPSGQTAATEVVATAPVDLDVMDCVKGVMTRWTFTRPRGGAVHLERLYAFRKAP